MQQAVSALVVYHQSEPLRALRQQLETLSVSTAHAASCGEAAENLAGPNPPHLVFTDTTLPDGTWEEVMALAAHAPLPVNVIVVARVVNTRFYVHVIEAGAFDFVAPPFAPADLSHVVRCAADNVMARREAQVRAQLSPQTELFSSFLHPALR